MTLSFHFMKGAFKPLGTNQRFLFGKSVRKWVIICKSRHTLLFLAEVVTVIWNALVAQQLNDRSLKKLRVIRVEVTRHVVIRNCKSIMKP